MRAVVVDLDGGEHTARCLRSLLATEWAGVLEVVMVDNGSRVPLDERIAPSPEVAIVRSSDNLGFAGGANLGIGDLGGVDAVALLNNDAVVPPGWLAPLVMALDGDASLAAACPKIRFAGTYRRALISPSGPARLDGVDGDGAVRFAPDVPAPTGAGAQRHRPIVAPTTFWVADGASLRLRLSAPKPTPVRIEVGDAVVDVVAEPTSAWFEIEPVGPLVALVNNVGTGWRDDGYGYDLGYLEPDDGRYDQEADVVSWCGGAVLLRAEHLRAAGCFDEELFLYYEDLDLALRGRAAGGRYRLVPSSIVDHDHSATAISGSPFAEYHKERNRLLVLLRHRGWRAATVAAARFAVATLGYVRRDVVVALIRGRRPSLQITALRLRALAGALRRAPLFRPGSRP